MKAFLIGDDMTGTNVSNYILAKNGFKVGTLTKLEGYQSYSDYDVLGVHTESRGIDKEEAYQRVYDTVKELSTQEFRFMNKRIDSTLRGNIGAEIQGMLDALGDEYVAVVAASFPDNQKVVIGNYMLVEGVMLEETDVSKDPTNPVTNSRVSTIISEQTDYNIATISMETINNGPKDIQDTLEAVVENGARIVIMDALTNQNLADTAEAVLASGIPFVSVDPGPFTFELTKATEDHIDLTSEKALFIIGSASPIMIDQIARLRADFNPYVIKLDTRKVVDDETRENEISSVVREIEANLEEEQLFLVATIIGKEDRLDLNALAEEHNKTLREVSQSIVEAIAEVGTRVLDTSNDEFGAVYASGGDVLQAFLEDNEVVGINILDEIEPLAGYGRIMGGRLDGKNIVMKGGLVGNSQTLSNCANYIIERLA